MGSLAGFAFDRPDGDVVEFPRVMRGLDYNLNWSLAGDQLTTRGEAYRNASVRDLIEFTPRSAARVTKDRALVVDSGAAPATASFATDILPGASVMDVSEAEERATALRDECLSFAPRLFIHDGCVGSDRLSELRVRVVTDSPVVALHFRSLLHRTPLYDAEAFPRTLTVLVGTLAAPDGAARKPLPGASSSSPAGPFTVVDVDPATAKAMVLAVGDVSLASLSLAVATAAGRLQALGGYRHVPGGDSNPNIKEARADGVLHWYLRDGHVYASPTEPHPELLPLQADVVVGSGGGAPVSLVLGNANGTVAAAAEAAGRLFSAHHAVWGPSGLASFWAGMCVPKKQQSEGAGLPRGALVAQGRVTQPLAAAASAPGGRIGAPQRAVLIDASAVKAGSGAAGSALTSEELVSRLTAQGAFAASGAAAPKLSATLRARLDAAGTQAVAVASAEQAAEVLGL